jgi:hypothetical protein
MERILIMKWINTVETIAEVEQAGTKGQWRIGDAIIRDLKDEGLLQNQVDSDGIPEIKGGVWEECTTKLAEKGIENAGTGKPFAYQYIGILFRTAYAFPRDERNAKFSWSVHRFAGTPQNLKNAITALRKVDKKVSTPNVAALIEHWADEADAKRQRELEKAKAKKTAAKKKKVTATEDKLATKDGAEREAAEARRQEAQREIEEATAVIKQAGGPPPYNANLDVDTSDVGALERWALYLGITANAMHMKQVAKKTLKEVEKVAHLLSNTEQQHIADGCNEVIEIMEHINKLVKRANPKLRVVGDAS